LQILTDYVNILLRKHMWT